MPRRNNEAKPPETKPPETTSLKGYRCELRDNPIIEYTLSEIPDQTKLREQYLKSCGVISTPHPVTITEIY